MYTVQMHHAHQWEARAVAPFKPAGCAAPAASAARSKAAASDAPPADPSPAAAVSSPSSSLARKKSSCSELSAACSCNATTCSAPASSLQSENLQRTGASLVASPSHMPGRTQITPIICACHIPPTWGTRLLLVCSAVVILAIADVLGVDTQVTIPGQGSETLV